MKVVISDGIEYAYLYFGETLFRADSCNADVRLGDLLIHEGPAFEAQAHAAKVFNADKTYFVLNGTSSSNKIAIGALVAHGDVYCIVPGEVWDGAVLDYFLALQEGVNRLPGFEPEVQGVYWEYDDQGKKIAYAYVLKQSHQI